MSSMNSHFEVTLESIAAVAFAASLWNKPEIKKRRIDLFKTDGESETCGGAFTAITSSLLEEVQGKELPESLKMIIYNLVRSMGKKIFKWTVFIQRKLRLKVEYAEEIYWTNIGTIDQVKIFHLLSADEELMSKQPISVYYLAAACAQLQFVDDKWKNIEHYLKYHDNHFYSLLAWTLVFLRKNFSIEEYKQVIFDHLDRSNVANLFHLAVIDGCDIAVKHYWDHLTITEQEERLITEAESCVDRYYSRRKRDKRCYKDNYIEILRFLLSKMTDQLVETFFLKNGSKVLNLFMSEWPWEELFIPLMLKFKHFLSAKQFCWILENIVDLLAVEYNVNFGARQNFYFTRFKIVWRSIPRALKQEIFELKDDNANVFYMIGILFKIYHLPALLIIIKDEDVKNYKNQVIHAGKFKFEEFVRQDKFELLNEFLNDVFTSEEEKNVFKLSLTFLEDLLVDDEFDIADKLMIWQMSTDVDREEFINAHIRSEYVCSRFIVSGRFGLVDKFLEWAFNSEEKRQSIKQIFKIKETMVKIIGTYWIRDRHNENNELLTMNFLKLITKSNEEADIIRKEELVTYDNFFKIFCNDFNFLRVNNYCEVEKINTAYKRMCYNQREAKLEVIKSFLKFCDVSEEKIKSLKREIADNITNSIFLSDAEDFEFLEFELFDYLLDWCTENDIEKETIISNIVNSDNYTFVRRKIILRLPENMTKFYNLWWKFHPNKCELKNEVLLEVQNRESLSEARKEKLCESYEKIFEKLEKNEELVPKDVVVDFDDDDDFFLEYDGDEVYNFDLDDDDYYDSDNYELLWGL